MSTDGKLAASFRDPSGFVFRRGGCLFRQVNQTYRDHYDHLLSSGLYAALAADGLLTPHDETDEPPFEPAGAYKVLRPQAVPFVSYPYEWCFSQLKAAALLTLRVQTTALAHGMTLKDASAYNVQFIGARPVFIDTLSFEKYAEGEPWVAYRQFCQHFLAPLALMSKTDVRLGQLLRVYIDGVPLDLAGALLPVSSRFRFGLLLHLHLHARTVKAFGGRAEKPKTHAMSRRALLGLIDSLTSAVRSLRWQPRGTEWIDYYETHNYAPEALELKKRTVGEFLDEVRPRTAWDLGANTGLFSRLAAERGAYTVAWDIDPACVEANHLEGARRDETSLLPLLLDLTNPSPGLGWAGGERAALAERGPADVALALGLIHHLAIGANVPLEAVARFLAAVARAVIIEFVPKDDPQVGRLLVSRKDVFPSYNQGEFEEVFRGHFTVCQCRPLAGSGRTLYLLRRAASG